jgi:hypothetical protein
MTISSSTAVLIIKCRDSGWASRSSVSYPDGGGPRDRPVFQPLSSLCPPAAAAPRSFSERGHTGKVKHVRQFRGQGAPRPTITQFSAVATRVMTSRPMATKRSPRAGAALQGHAALVAAPPESLGQAVKGAVHALIAVTRRSGQTRELRGRFTKGLVPERLQPRRLGNFAGNFAALLPNSCARL